MALTVEEALEFAQSILEPGSMNKAWKIVFCQCWQGHSYQEIANNVGYEVGYVRDVGARLWQSLSKAMGVKVSKCNFQEVLQQYCPKPIFVPASSAPETSSGLTIKEYFAAAALQGLLANPCYIDRQDVAAIAAARANELVAAMGGDVAIAAN